MISQVLPVTFLGTSTLGCLCKHLFGCGLDQSTTHAEQLQPWAEASASSMVKFGFSLEQSSTINYDCGIDVDKQHDAALF